MPPGFVPIRSGVHRASCIALYRALLRQGAEIQLPLEKSQLYYSLLRKTFRKNAKLQRPAEIIGAMELGYKTLHVFNGLLHNEQLESPHRRGAIQKLEIFLDQARALRSPTPNPTPPTEQPMKTRHRAPKPWPGATPVLERPYPNLSGRRHVPKFIWANGIPVLRFKKPQSSFLSHIITSKIMNRERSLMRSQKLHDLIYLALQEDKWDAILDRSVGSIDNERIGEGDSWATELEVAQKEQEEAVHASTARTLEIANKMHKIVLAEKRLAAKEAAGRKWRRRLSKKMPNMPEGL